MSSTSIDHEKIHFAKVPPEPLTPAWVEMRQRLLRLQRDLRVQRRVLNEHARAGRPGLEYKFRVMSRVLIEIETLLAGPPNYTSAVATAKHVETYLDAGPLARWMLERERPDLVAEALKPDGRG